MKKTLGGDRLGSGNNMKVELHGYERSTQDLGYLFRSTMSAGTLVPFLNEIALPGDTFDIDLRLDMKTLPTVGPLFGSYKAQLDVFQCPIRLYQGKLHNNKLGIGMKMSTVKLPVIRLFAPEIDPSDLGPLIDEGDIDNCQINPSSILSYLGIRGIGMFVTGVGSNGVRDFNGIDLLSYWDVVKQYYSNKQEEIGAVIHNQASAPDTNIIDIAVGGSTLPQSPTVTPIPLNFGTLIEINKTLPGAIGSMGKVAIINTMPAIFGNSMTIEEIAVLIDDNGTVETWRYRHEIFGNRDALNWRYITGADMVKNEINITTFPLENIDTMRELILADVQSVGPFEVLGAGGGSLAPYYLLRQASIADPTYRSIMGSQEGLALKTYQSDLLNNWLQTEWIDGTDGITEITSVDTTAGFFTLDTLNLSKKVYDMLNRIAVSGGTYNDWIDAVYTHDRYIKAESPMYMGGLIKELVFQEVVSNAEASANGESTQPLGTLAGRGILGQKHKGGEITIKVDEPSLILGIVSLTPRIDYSQGNNWHVHLKTMDDLHKPALDEIGFQELITEQMAWWDTHQDGTGAWIQKSAGKQPAWINYMTNINRVRGNFAIQNAEMFMVLTRRYEAEHGAPTPGVVNIKDLTTYIDPRKFNHMFAQTSLDSQNFWCQIAVDMTCRRKISAKLIPNL